MRLAAVLCWYDEPVEFLERCILSLADACDRLVAVDGRWDRFPGDNALSPMKQAIALRRATRAAGLPLRELALARPWPSQIAKRNAALELGAIDGADWMLVIDGDEYVADADPQPVRAALAVTEHDVAKVTMRNVTGDDFRGVDRPHRRIFRAGTTVSASHQGYTLNGATLDGDTRRGLKLASALDLTDALRIEHTPRSRGAERNAAAVAYRHARARIGEL